VEPIRSLGTNVRQPIDGLLRRLSQCHGIRVDTHGQVQPGLDGVCLPVGLSDVRGAVTGVFPHRIRHDCIGKVRARDVERAQHQQQEHAHSERELNHRLGFHCFRKNEQERGQILVMFAITATAMLALIGLLYSFGMVLAQRRAEQSAADAASLAGTWQVLAELTNDTRSDANVWNKVLTYAENNGAQPSGVSAVYVDTSGNQVSSVGGGGQFGVTVRGVQVTVSGNVQTILPGFVRLSQLLVQDNATALARATASPVSAQIIPIAVSASSYSPHASYDLFGNPPSGSAWATLDLSSAGAPTFTSPSINEQYWSDGQHLGSWQLTQPRSANLANAAYYDSVAAGLQDNVRRQGNGYALVFVPVYDTNTSTTVHVVGFSLMKLTGSSITATSAPGVFVPYAAAAYGAPQVPSPDVGASLVGLTS
jgi:Flp pilus assembly protein TadG